MSVNHEVYNLFVLFFLLLRSENFAMAFHQISHPSSISVYFILLSFIFRTKGNEKSETIRNENDFDGL